MDRICFTANAPFFPECESDYSGTKVMQGRSDRQSHKEPASFGNGFGLPTAALLSILVCLTFFATRSEALAQDTSGDQQEIVSFRLPVSVEQGSVYAGPGKQYYVTRQMAAGEIVEVYLRQEDGWCAIRPPAGSFSWINGKYVTPDEQNGGTITWDEQGREVPVRVGAPSVMKSTVIQVGLANGRRVQIRGEMQLPGGAVWYKIAPPAGEFRWIHESELGGGDTLAQIPKRLTTTRDYLASFDTGAKDTASQVVFQQEFQAKPTDIPEYPSTEQTASQRATGSDPIPELAADVSRKPFTASGYITEQEMAQADIIPQYERFIPETPAYQPSEYAGRYDATNTSSAVSGPVNGWLLDANGNPVPVPSSRQPVVSTVPRPESGSQQGKTAKKMQFAFSGDNSPFRGWTNSSRKVASTALTSSGPAASHHEAKSRSMPILMPPKAGPTIVPPHDYQPMAPPMSTGDGRNSSAVPPATPAAPKPSFMAIEGDAPHLSQYTGKPASDPIRPVSATLTPNQLVPENSPRTSVTSGTEKPLETTDGSATWRAPADVAGQTQSRPSPAAGATSRIGAPPRQGQPVPWSGEQVTPSVSASGAFDAMGIFGYFPDRPEGYPRYALLRQQGSEMTIVCYVEAESGENLDRFIGKTIGVKGTRGWYRGVGDTRPVVTARTIFCLK
ncbi:MAG: hypothetical protein Q4G68_07855 [Planctomycetia bacterium]|nr:hypothetical protein [Planctomycetia bacterium]